MLKRNEANSCAPPPSATNLAQQDYQPETDTEDEAFSLPLKQRLLDYVSETDSDCEKEASDVSSESCYGDGDDSRSARNRRRMNVSKKQERKMKQNNY